MPRKQVLSAHPRLRTRLAWTLRKVVSIGDLPSHSDEEKTEHHFLIYMGMLMSVGGLIWGTVSFYHGLYIPATFPYGYAALTFVNLLYFHYSKNFRAARFNQVLISLLLPFLFQWSLGGFVPSGAVMLWAFIALAGSLTFQDVRSGARWLFAFLALTIVSGIIDDKLQDYRLGIPQELSTLFFVLNIVCITTIVFFLLLYLLSKRDEAKAKVAEMSSVLKQMFGRYLSAKVMDSLIENPSELELGGKRKNVTIMMTDLRGFTALSENLQPEQVVQLLNTYFEVMVDVVLKYDGTINEFIGDCLLVIFGAPQEMADRAQRALACAIEMQNAMQDVNTRNNAAGLPELQMGIGLNETEVVVGNIGSTKRSKYGVVGSGVNLTSRIESYTVGGQILASRSVVDQVGDILRIDGQREIYPKGAETPLTIYEVGGIGGDYDLTLLEKPFGLRTLIHAIRVRCTLIADKKLETEQLDALITQLSREGAAIVMPGHIELYSNFKLRLVDVDDQIAAHGFYGKVVRQVSATDHTYLIAFTSVPSEIAAYFSACRQYGVTVDERVGVSGR